MLESIINGLAFVGVMFVLKILFNYGKNVIDHFFYKSVKVEGKWTTILVNDTYTEEVELKRFGYNVSGTIKCMTSPDNIDNGKIYKFKGTFKDKLLIANYSLKDENGAIDPGCIFIELVDGSNHFKGHTLIYQHIKDELISAEYEWKRA